jgi:hypothetical protein
MEQILNGTDFEFWTVFGFKQIFGFEQVSNWNNFESEQFRIWIVSNWNIFEFEQIVKFKQISNLRKKKCVAQLGQPALEAPNRIPQKKLCIGSGTRSEHTS